MTGSSKGERVVVTTVVAVSPAAAFEIFTRDIDRWWRRFPRYRSFPGSGGTLAFEGDPPERLVERHAATSTEIGRVTNWTPGQRVAFEWRHGPFTEADGTEVDVRFEAHPSGTRVTLEHKGIGALRPDHPSRHGLSGEAFEAMLGYFWADLLASYRRNRGGNE